MPATCKKYAPTYRVRVCASAPGHQSVNPLRSNHPVVLFSDVSVVVCPGSWVPSHCSLMVGLGTLPGSSPLYTLNRFRSNYYNSCPHRLFQGAPYASRSSSSTTHAMNYYTHLHAHTEDVRRRHHYSPLVSLSRLKILNDQLPTVDSRH